MSVMSKAALAYAVKLGWPVIPLRGKDPITQHGSKDATRDPEAIAGWWKKAPEANVGLATGITFFVLDVDTKNGGDLSLEQLEAKYGKLPDTIQQITGTGGRHYLFALPDFIVHNSQSKIAPGIDVRGVGGYIVAAPSIHPDTGKAYVWDGLESILHQKLLAAPQWLLDALRASSQNGKAPHVIPTGKIQKGKQHDTLFAIGCSMRARGLEFPEIFEALKATNTARCSDPGTVADMRKMAESICTQYEPGQHPKPGSKNGSKPPALSPMDEILSTEYEEIMPMIEDLLYPGLTVFAGKSKLGKSWFSLQLAIALVSQTPLAEYFDIQKPARVLYLSLEERKRQTKKRLQLLLPNGNDFLHNINVLYDIPALLAGGATMLDQILTEHPAEVVIIDSLMAFVQQAARGKVDAMQADYNIVNTIKALADKHKAAFVVVAHTRKAPGEALDTVQGTMGLIAAADAVWVLQRNSSGDVLLTVTGREVYTTVFALSHIRDRGWKVTAQGDEAEQGEERREVLALLRETGPMKLANIARSIRKSLSASHSLLGKLIDAGLVRKTNYGTYRLSNQDDPT